MLQMSYIVEILQIITASSVLFVWVVRYDNIINEFKEYRLPAWLRDLVGILKITFAIMLLLGVFFERFKYLGAGGLLILMMAALLTHVRVKNPAYKAFPSFTLFSFSAIILFGEKIKF
tara:strand:+ start:214 stop:567 length:354 start_codon:yes stop_codon:yes gene_type:complete